MYSIKQTAEKTGLTAHTLRFYEKDGVLPPIQRDSAGRRVYSEENIAWLEIVTCLKMTNMSMKDIREIVNLSIQGGTTIEARKEILIKHRKAMVEQLQEIKKSIEKIDKKIAYYDGADEC